jgi:tetratricopeptide (TPR) repeat protein
MGPYYTIGLLAFVILLAILLIRYVNNTVDSEFRSLARSVSDPGYRRERLADVDSRLQHLLPLPPDAAPLPKPGAAGGLAPPMLLALGVILLWGAGAAHGDRHLWLYGGMVALLAAILVMLSTLRRRRRARVARLLLFRADLRRMDGDRSGAAADLGQLIRLTPWDDSAWAEYSDDLAANGQLEEALMAMDRAAGLDPAYDEYRQLQVSLAIRLGRLDRARQAIGDWTGLDGVKPDDPRLAIYRAALQLAGGEREDAAETLRGALVDRNASAWEYLDNDSALSGVKDLLPGKH